LHKHISKCGAKPKRWEQGTYPIFVSLKHV
jgi:hypothetical protein